MSFHKDLVSEDIHVITAATYADIAARDADSDFNTTSTNVDKTVRVDSPLAYYILVSTTPTWESIGSSVNNQWTELTDTPGAISANLIVQGNSGGTALEFGQALGTQSDIALNTTHRASDGSDHSDVVLNTTHRTSDGKDHSDVVLNNTHRTSDGKDHSDVVLNNTHRASDGTDHSDVVLNNTHRSSDGSDHTFINQDVTTSGTPTFGVTTLGDSSQLATSAAPTADADIANKKYVDDTAGNAGGFTLNFDANDAIFPDSNPVVAGSRNNHPILGFDDTTAESIIFNNTIPNNYDGEDINVDIDWVAETATTGGVTWGVEIEANAPGGNDIDSDSFDTQQTGTSTTNGTSGIIKRTTITLTQVEADAIAANDSFRLRVQRVTGDGGDTMTGDAEIIKVSVRV